MDVLVTPESLRAIASLPQFEHPRAYGQDASNPYYNFLAHLVVAMQPNFVVELGTCTGGSTSYLAAGGAKRVVSIDVELREDARVGLIPFPNIELWTRDTSDASLPEEIKARGPVDLLFIDTIHVPAQAGMELERFGPLVRPGGLILFDDIRIDAAMSAWWEALHGTKLELPELHWSGFGVLLR